MFAKGVFRISQRSSITKINEIRSFFFGGDKSSKAEKHNAVEDKKKDESKAKKQELTGNSDQSKDILKQECQEEATKTKPVVDPPPKAALTCTPSVIEGITGGRTDICLYTKAPCDVQVCDSLDLALESICNQEQITSNIQADVNVIVVGAGMAGVAAASYLVKNGITNTTVLEATSRPGGRIRSVLLDGKVVELGAPCPPAYHRTCNCPVTSLAINHGFLKHGQTDPTNGLLVNCDGTERPLPICMLGFQEFLDIREELKCVRYPPGEEDELIQSFLKIRLNHVMETMPEDFREVAIRTIAGLLTMVTTPQIETDTAASYVVAGGIRVPLGHISLIAPYLEQIGFDRIIYNKKVTKIKWGTVTREQRPRALAVCSDGSSYSADYIILTVPLGVLQADMDSLFCPNLPANKTNAISKATLLHKEVMFLSWSLPMWVWREMPLNRIWTEEDMECRDGWMKSIRSVEEVPGTDSMLKVTVEGSEVKAFSRMTDLEIMNDFTKFLQEWQGDKRIPLPSSMFRSTWSGDKCFRGAMPIVTNPEIEKQLMTPVPCGCGNDPIIFFAGDWTAPNYCGQVGGALVSGFREAEKVLSYVGDDKEEQRHPCFVQKLR